jgi:zinc protease
MSVQLNTSPVRRWHRIVPAAVLAALALAPLNAAVRPPRMQYSTTTLPNGLTVVLSEDHSTPIVHADLWYHVGSKDERPGRTGFAHLFEHMMFKGSKNVDPEGHTSMIAGVGGQSNAYTNDDTTVFWETVPSQYLPLILWLEADRMATLKIDEATFKAEREVVKEERRLRIDNQPFGRLTEILYAKAFTVHPYMHTTIGSMVDLDAAAVADVRDFHNTYYVPGNATLALVGDFDSDERKALHHDGELAPAGGGGGVPHHIRRPSGFLSAAPDVEDPVGRRKLAHLQVARV